MKVFRYDLNLGKITQIFVPRGAKLLTVNCVRKEHLNVPSIWFLVDENADKTTHRSFIVYATGEPIVTPKNSRGQDCAQRYVSTFIINRNLVFHAFEIEGMN